jgi:hypothetical protein
LWPFGKYVVIWYIFTHFGKLFQEKSGNPGVKHWTVVFVLALSFFKYFCWVADVFFSHFISQTMHNKSIYIHIRLAMVSPNYFTPWRDSNRDLPQADALTTAPLRQGVLVFRFDKLFRS